MVEQKKRRPTVNVICGVKQGVLMRVVKPDNELDADWPWRVSLKEGSNPGIDKAFYAAWLAENPSLSIVTNGMINAVPEKTPPEQPEVEQPEGPATVPPEAVKDEPGDPTPQIIPHTPVNP
jgi:hypothetical protein